MLTPAKFLLVSLRLDKLLLVSILLSGLLVGACLADTDTDTDVAPVDLLSVDLLAAEVLPAKVSPAKIAIATATDLRQDALVARQMSAPIMLYFSDPACGYCRKLEKEIFLPMLRSGDYQDRVLLRKISWLSRGLLNDFDGSKRELHAIAERYNVQVTPTMIFVDEDGVEIAKRILGYNGPDFFWFYLDRAIDEGQVVLLKRMQKN